MHIQGENYTVEMQENTINISGTLRLNGLEEYSPILELLREATASSPVITLNLSGLEFLNSSGIAMLSKFIIEARSNEQLSLTINGSSSVPWQGKSLKNLQRLWPALELNIA